MIIYPAIDLRNGKCVRLYQGDYSKETVYNTDPYCMINSFIAQGAKWVHLIDLDGAKSPNNNQQSLITSIIKSCNIDIQTGGGIRERSQVQNLLEHGAKRIIVGSLAITNPNEVSEWLRFFGPDQIVLALDITFDNNKKPMIAIHGWQSSSTYSLVEMVEYYQTKGLKHLLCTDVSRDGTLSGPNHLLYNSLLNQFPFLKLQASGGIRSISDLKILRSNGLAGSVVGKALYEQQFTLSEAILC